MTRDERLERLQEYYDKLQPALLKALADAGVVSVEVHFYGSGDSGSIEDIHFNYADPVNTKRANFNELKLPWVKARSAWNETTKTWDYLIDETNISVTDIIEDMVYTAAAESGVDWYNNEGGGGSWTLNMEPGKAPTLDFNIYYNETRRIDADNWSRPFV